ncbi:nicotinate phosphoribosyltransferase [soil metagenome]
MDQHSPGLLTDRYEFTMLSSFVADGHVDRPAVFEAFARHLPPGRRYSMLAGLGRLLPMIRDFRFDAAELDWLLDVGAITAATAHYLADFRFRGSIDAVPEGELAFPGTPVLTVDSTLGEGLLLETLVLSVLNHDTAVASAAARIVTAARASGTGRPLIEMGSRRVHERAAIAAARAAYIAGFTSTSNLAAGFEFGIPTVGTAAHAFTLAHASELDAFRSQIAALGVGTSLLIDTYDIADGVRTAVAAARETGATGPGSVRIDSADLAEESATVRRLLDELGAVDTQITVTSDLDEFVITALAGAPIDGFGVGTRVATGSGHPTAGMVYKLVAVGDSDDPDAPLRPVAKASSGKISIGGRKQSWRTYGPRGTITGEFFTVGDTAPPDGAVGIQVPAIRNGDIVHAPSLDQIRARAAASLATLPAGAMSVAAGEPAVTATAWPIEPETPGDPPRIRSTQKPRQS